MKTTMKLLTTLGAGALMMYLADPERGKARRALLTDQIKSKAQRVKSSAKKAKRDLANRARGAMAESASASGAAADPVDDFILAERVRSELGRAVSNVGTIEVAADHGRVTLNGTVEAAEMDDLLSRVRSVNGVSDVENQLVVH